MTSSHAFRPSAKQLLEPLGIVVLERGWLSSNNVVLLGRDSAAVVDTGYATHAALTVELINTVLGDRPLRHILNTHLHSDHCGGNAALKAHWPSTKIAIPPGLASAVHEWDRKALTHEPTGQLCERFQADQYLMPGSVFRQGRLQWEIHAAGGHDPHAVILFEPSARVLISADALWNNGFGVVFPELEGESGFDDVGDTLALIESLAPDVVIPGHGPVFSGDAIDVSLERARSRLNQLRSDPARHRRHALKVLIKFKLLEWQRTSVRDLALWFASSPYFTQIVRTDSHAPMHDILADLLDELESSNALRRVGDHVLNT